MSHVVVKVKKREPVGKLASRDRVFGLVQLLLALTLFSLRPSLMPQMVLLLMRSHLFL